MACLVPLAVICGSSPSLPCVPEGCEGARPGVLLGWGLGCRGSCGITRKGSAGMLEPGLESWLCCSV